MKNMKWIRRLWPYALLAVLVATNVLAWSQREAIADWWRLRDYKPPQSIAALASDTSMTKTAQRLFYINWPSLEDKEDFNKHCSDKSVETAVLGCYHGNRQGIYLYAVTDARLAGVRQVTAAHEMLHQAYDRLSSEERTHINTLLEDYYRNRLADEDIRTKLESYAHQTDADLTNEMHSIFGSEIRDLPAELEIYYKRYFVDRSRVVDFRETYQGEFTRREKLVEQYDSQLADLKNHINANKATLEAKLTVLQSKEKEISQDVALHDQAAYQQDVNTYNATVATYNTLLSETRSLIDRHNSIVNDRNALAIQERELQQALDSRLDTPNKMQ